MIGSDVFGPYFLGGSFGRGTLDSHDLRRGKPFAVRGDLDGRQIFRQGRRTIGSRKGEEK